MQVDSIRRCAVIPLLFTIFPPVDIIAFDLIMMTRNVVIIPAVSRMELDAVGANCEMRLCRD